MRAPKFQLQTTRLSHILMALLLTRGLCILTSFKTKIAVGSEFLPSQNSTNQTKLVGLFSSRYHKFSHFESSCVKKAIVKPNCLQGRWSKAISLDLHCKRSGNDIFIESAWTLFVRTWSWIQFPFEKDASSLFWHLFDCSHDAMTFDGSRNSNTRWNLKKCEKTRVLANKVNSVKLAEAGLSFTSQVKPNTRCNAKLLTKSELRAVKEVGKNNKRKVYIAMSDQVTKFSVQHLSPFGWRKWGFAKRKCRLVPCELIFKENKKQFNLLCLHTWNAPKFTPFLTSGLHWERVSLKGKRTSVFLFLFHTCCRQFRKFFL